MKLTFPKGLIDGIPIALGYLSVSFGFGIVATNAGLSVLAALGISMSNLTSAGQAAGVGIIAAGGTSLEMLLTQLVINMRYALMGITLSQKLDDSFTTPRRMIAAFGITDEIFALAASKPGTITPKYMYGLIVLPFIGWSLGTFLGAVASTMLPAMISSAMGIVLYAMFFALIIPPARKDYHILVVIMIAVGLSILFSNLFFGISSGFVIIISAVVASALGAVLYPMNFDDEEEAA